MTNALSAIFKDPRFDCVFNFTYERRIVMAIFFMFGKYTPEARREISAKRTQQAIEAIHKLGGEVNAIKASLTLSDLTGISFTTCPAVTIEAFDELAHSAA
jgi:hypothetical protein